MKVVVVGGGLAGLFTAFELMQRDIDDVVVLEKAPRAGGVARTIEEDGFSLEPAVGAFNLPHPQLSGVLDRAGVETEPADRASLRYVYIDGRLVALPAAPRALLAPVLSVRSKLRTLLEPFIPANPADDESLADFARRRFGEQAGEMISSLMATGVFAGDPHRLSVAAAFPALAELERAHGSVVKGVMMRIRARPPGQERPRPHVPTGGMRVMVDSLIDTLGDRLRPGFVIESLRRERQSWIVEGTEHMTADVVILAVPPDAAAGLVEGRLAATLRQFSAAPVAVVFLGGPGPTPLPDGFGILVGPGESLSTRGILFESSYAPARAPKGSWLAKVIVGGAGSAVDEDDESLVSTVIAEIGAVLATDVDPDFVKLVRHHPGIPQYELGHRSRLAELDRLLGSAPGLHLTGWGYRGVGVAQLAGDAARLADEITSGS